MLLCSDALGGVAGIVDQIRNNGAAESKANMYFFIVFTRGVSAQRD